MGCCVSDLTICWAILWNVRLTLVREFFFRSIVYLLMPCRHKPPGHQQVRYWPYTQYKSYILYFYHRHFYWTETTNKKIICARVDCSRVVWLFVKFIELILFTGGYIYLHMTYAWFYHVRTHYICSALFGDFKQFGN